MRSTNNKTSPSLTNPWGRSRLSYLKPLLHLSIALYLLKKLFKLPLPSRPRANARCLVASKKDDTLQKLVDARLMEDAAKKEHFHCPQCGGINILPRISVEGRSGICVNCDFVFPLSFFKRND